jgi:ubiquinone/menaquinone biosynthesis C-methylase UbiE
MNLVEVALMNNPLRRLFQRHLEAPLFRRLAGARQHQRVLEIGCGQGVGIDLAFRAFGARFVDAFDVDPRMVATARRRVVARGSAVRLWVGDAAAIAVADGTYDAVFDFGILHHVEAWRSAVREVARVLRPGGIFYAEEALARVIRAPVVRHLLRHPVADRFDAPTFTSAMREAGLEPFGQVGVAGLIAWWVAVKSVRACTDHGADS